MPTKDKYKLNMAVGSLVAAILLGTTAMFIPPQGIIDASVLWFTAQLLVFTATLLGLSFNIDMMKQNITNMENKIKEEQEHKNI